MVLEPKNMKWLNRNGEIGETRLRVHAPICRRTLAVRGFSVAKRNK
jgi:hypothetical protein